MPGPPPPPPPPPPSAPGPPPPPPPPPPGPGKSSAPPPSSKGRDALFGDIEKGGFKLKKAVTNDRSAPQVVKPKEEPAAAGGGGSGASAGGGRAAAAAGPMGLGGLFAGGIPKLRSAGARTAADTQQPSAPVSAVVRPQAPAAMTSRQSTTNAPSLNRLSTAQPPSRISTNETSANTAASQRNDDDDSPANEFSNQLRAAANRRGPAPPNPTLSAASRTSNYGGANENQTPATQPSTARKTSAMGRPPPPLPGASAGAGGPPPVPPVGSRPELPGGRNGATGATPPSSGGSSASRPFAPPPPPPPAVSASANVTPNRSDGVLLRSSTAQPPAFGGGEAPPPPVPERRSMRPASTIMAPYSAPSIGAIPASGSAMNLNSAAAPRNYGMQSSNSRQSAGSNWTEFESRFSFRQPHEFPIPQMWNQGPKSYPSKSRKNQQRISQNVPSMPPPPPPPIPK